MILKRDQAEVGNESLAVCVERAARLRASVRDPKGLTDEAERLLAVVPAECDVLVAWSHEGFAVAAAAAIIAQQRGRSLLIERASHLTPLTPAPAVDWTWVNVEKVLGLGEVRPWAKRWADQRGGRLLSVDAATSSSELDLVA